MVKGHTAHTATFDWGCAFLGNSGIIHCYDTDGYLLGTIQANATDWELIQSGHDPIDERWEDGCGNILSLNGWEQAK